MLFGYLGILIAAATGFMAEVPDTLKTRLVPTNEVRGVFVQTKTLPTGEKFVSSGDYCVRPGVDFSWRTTDPFDTLFFATQTEYVYSNEDEIVSRPLKDLPGFSSFAEAQAGDFSGYFKVFDSLYKEEDGRFFVLSRPKVFKLKKVLERVEIEGDSTNLLMKATFPDKTTIEVRLTDVPSGSAGLLK